MFLSREIDIKPCQNYTKTNKKIYKSSFEPGNIQTRELCKKGETK